MANTENENKYASLIIAKCGKGWEVDFNDEKAFAISNKKRYSICICENHNLIEVWRNSESIIWIGLRDDFLTKAKITENSIIIDGVDILNYNEPTVDMGVDKKSPIKLTEDYQDKNVEKVIRALGPAWECKHYRGCHADFYNGMDIHITTDKDNVYVTKEGYYDYDWISSYESFFKAMIPVNEVIFDPIHC